MGAAVYENGIYVIAGENEKGVTGEVARYDPQKNLWDERKPKPLPQAGVRTGGGRASRQARRFRQGLKP